MIDPDKITGKTDDLPVLFSALEFAARKHQFQKRKGAGGIPYINHLIEVPAFLTRHMDDPQIDLLISAILHDVLEDTDARQGEIQEQFGKSVLTTILEVTDNMRLPSFRRKSLQIKHAKALSYHARCIKIADKSCNIRDILYTRLKWSRRRKLAYVEWAEKVVGEIRDTHNGLINEFDKIVTEAKEGLKKE